MTNYISNCCGAPGDAFDVDYLGKCPECKEGCVFEEEKQTFQEQEEKLIY